MNMFLRFALKRAAACGSSLSRLQKPVCPSPHRFSSTLRSFATNGSDSITLQMINYAFSHAKSQKSGESYAQALLVLEQGLSNVRGGDTPNQDAAGMLLLAMSTLLSHRGQFDDAMEKLQMVLDLGESSLGARVAAWEGLVGLHLKTGKDDTSSVLADKCLQLLRNRPENEDCTFEPLSSRVNAIKGLVELVLGNIGSAESYFGMWKFKDAHEDKCFLGNVALSYGEFLHATGNFSLAKNFYQKALQACEADEFSEASVLTAANMVPEEVSFSATCALGQLAIHLGNFQDAEETLTKALTKAEEHFGANHPKVGVVLTCLAVMFGHKAKLEQSSSLLIQEGLFRRAIDLLKGPTSETEETPMDRRDILALARGGYAEALCVQQNRKEEGERIRKWAESVWRNRRLSLAEALEIAEPSKVAVIDTRVSSVI